MYSEMRVRANRYAEWCPIMHGLVFWPCTGRRNSLHKGKSVWDGPSKDVGVEHHDDADDGAQRDGMPDHETEDRAFVADLIGGGGGDGDGLRVHHFAHHAPGA